MASIPSQAYLNEDGRSGLLIANILAIVFSGLFFAGRMASRLMKKSHKECSFDASDYNLLAGMILAWTAFALIIYGQSSSQILCIQRQARRDIDYWLAQGTTQGLGRHLEAIAMTDPELAGPTRIMQVSNDILCEYCNFYITVCQCLIAVECFYLVCLACIKISFLLLFRKVFPGTYFRRITEIVGAIVIAATIVGCFVGIFACRPINAFWDFTPSPTAKCMNIELYMIGNWVHNVVTDLAILCLPQTMIWKLQIDRKSKIALAFTLLLGSLYGLTNYDFFNTYIC